MPAHELTSDENAVALQPGHVLRGQYTILRILGRPGGFGITYLARDSRLESNVAIKEFLPVELATRSADRATVVPYQGEKADMFRFGLERFIEEARTIARVDHPNVVRVKTFFIEHGTAYIVMDYYEGQGLAGYLERTGGRLPWRVALDVSIATLDGLTAVHARGILHRDIKPSNVFLTRNGKPIILDFGAACQDLAERSRSVLTILTPPYAPIEQYGTRGQGAWTDVYAVAVMLYELITGVRPAASPDRMTGTPVASPRTAVPDLPLAVCDAIHAGMALSADHRPRSAAAFQELLVRATEGVRPAVVPAGPVASVPSVREKTKSPSGPVNAGRKIGLIIAGVGMLVLIGIAVALLSSRAPESAGLDTITVVPAPPSIAQQVAQAATSAPASVPAPAPKPAAPTVHVVRMIGDSIGYRFEPDSLSMYEGEAVRFVMESGGPHNIAFDDSELLPQVREQLDANMQNKLSSLSSTMLMNPGEAYTMSFAHVPPGRYAVRCTPHLAMNMKMTIDVRAKN